MEKNFYSKNLPKQLVPTQELWPLACFHCGSADGSEVNATLAELHTTVYPQCSGCRGKKVKVVTAGKKKKNTAAPDARHRAAQQQAGVDAARRSARQPVPEPMESWEVANVVGKSIAGKMKKAFLKTSAGQLCSKDDCTWSNESSAFFDGAAGELKPELLSSAEITCEASGAIYNAWVGMQAPNGLFTQHAVHATLCVCWPCR